MAKDMLLVVDVQNGFINPQSEHILRPLCELINRWREESKGPVVFSRFVNLPHSPWQKLMGWENLRGEPETALHKDLPVNDSPVFKKGTYSAWSSEIKMMFEGQEINKIYVCGIDTDQCVMATAMDIFEANLVPIVLADMCASSAGGDFHQAGLKLIRRLIGEKQVVNSGQI